MNRLVLHITEPLILRFWSRVDKKSTDECWPWTASLRNGYGAIKHERHVFNAHVVAYILSTGKQPLGGHVIAHKCDNKICCNPAHLECVTNSKNVLDAYRRTGVRSAVGEHNPNTKLTPELVRTIRDLHRQLRLGPARVSQLLGLSQTTVQNVISNRTWKHLQ